MSKIRIKVDMDDTIAAFIGDERLRLVPIEPSYLDYKEMHLPKFFRDLKPLPGAIEAVNKLLDSDLFDIYILSVPLATSPHSYSEKVEWINQYLPRLSKKIILTQDKSLIMGDYLIDDSLHWKEKWEGSDTTRKFIHFNPRKNSQEQWNTIVDYFLSKYGVKDGK